MKTVKTTCCVSYSYLEHAWTKGREYLLLDQQSDVVIVFCTLVLTIGHETALLKYHDSCGSGHHVKFWALASNRQTTVYQAQNTMTTTLMM